MIMQPSFSDVEYASKKKLKRRDRFLAQIETVTPWQDLEQVIERVDDRPEMTFLTERNSNHCLLSSVNLTRTALS